MNRIWIGLAVHILAIAGTGDAAAFDYLAWPDGRKVLVVQPNSQVDLSLLRSGIAGRATDRRFDTNKAMYLANEVYLSGTEFFLRASKKKLPLAHDVALSFITNVEAYWYSRYNLMSVSARSRAGIGVIHGPYLDLLARKVTLLNRFGRMRGELAVSNKDVMLTKVIASYLARTGLPKIFGNAVPMMLEFKSGDPRLVRPLDLEADESGRPRYLNDFETLRWSHDGMDKTIDMGGVGQAMLKKILWAKFFMRRNHKDDDFPGQVFLGNNAADGFRGAVLTLESVSTMLLAKAALFHDPSRGSLTGINPTTYKPGDGVRYLPHEIRPSLIYMSDIPVRHYDLATRDATSRLWDKASWLWAVTEFFDFSNPRRRDNWDRVFGYQTPFDGSVMEQKYALLAQGLANTFLANLEAMHRVDGVLVSTWTPDGGPGARVAISDLTLAMVALEAYVKYIDLEPRKRERAKKLLESQADFLLKVVGADGSYVQEYSVPDGVGRGKRDMTSQAFAVRALLVAYDATGDARYLAAARRTSATWNRDFWDDRAWLYRNDPKSEKVVYTPVDVAAVLAALREMILIDKSAALVDRFKKFFVQSLDASGMMQSEDIFTGEIIEKVRAGNSDSDGDGIPFLSKGDGARGIDTVFASRVEFDLSKFRGPAKSVSSAPPPRHRGGQRIFVDNCAVCHGPGGVGNEGPRLINNQFVQLTGRSTVMTVISEGRISVGMPAWGGILSRQEIARVTDYIRGLNPDRGAKSKPTRATNSRPKSAARAPRARAARK